MFAAKNLAAQMEPYGDGDSAFVRVATQLKALADVIVGVAERGIAPEPPMVTELATAVGEGWKMMEGVAEMGDENKTTQAEEQAAATATAEPPAAPSIDTDDLAAKLAPALATAMVEAQASIKAKEDEEAAAQSEREEELEAVKTAAGEAAVAAFKAELEAKQQRLGLPGIFETWSRTSPADKRVEVHYKYSPYAPEDLAVAGAGDEGVQHRRAPRGAVRPEARPPRDRDEGGASCSRTKSSPRTSAPRRSSRGSAPSPTSAWVRW